MHKRKCWSTSRNISASKEHRPSKKIRDDSNLSLINYPTLFLTHINLAYINFFLKNEINKTGSMKIKPIITPVTTGPK